MRKRMKFLVSVLCIVCICLLIYPPTRMMLLDFVIPCISSATFNALDTLAESLDNGETISDAVAVFCNAIMDVR